MVVIVRVARVLILLALVLVTLSLVMGAASAGTGPLEKVVLLGLIAGCLYVAAKVSTLATRFARHHS